VTLIEQTYLDLLDALGPKLGPEALRQLAADDPFRVPETPGLDTDSLQRRLRDFEAMLTARRWVAPDVRTGIREALGRRIAGVEDARVRRQTAVDKVQLDQKIIVPGGASHYLVSPDGRWVVMEDTYARRPPGSASPIFVYDTQAKKYVVHTDDHLSADLTFASDGKHLLTVSTGVLYKFPFENGRIAWEKETKIGDTVAGALRSEPVVTSDPAQVYVRPTSSLMFAFDPQSDTRTPLTLGGKPLPLGNVLDWGVVPGTTHLFIRSTVPGENINVLKTYSFDAKGHGTELSDSWTLPVWQGSKPYPSGTGELILKDTSRAVLYPKGGGEGIPLELPARWRMGQSTHYDVVVRPQTREVAILLNPRENVMEIGWYSLETGARTRTTTLPNDHYSRMKITPDGSKLFLYSAFNELALVNPDR